MITYRNNCALDSKDKTDAEEYAGRKNCIVSFRFFLFLNNCVPCFQHVTQQPHVSVKKKSVKEVSANVRMDIRRIQQSKILKGMMIVYQKMQVGKIALSQTKFFLNSNLSLFSACDPATTCTGEKKECNGGVCKCKNGYQEDPAILNPDGKDDCVLKDGRKLYCLGQIISFSLFLNDRSHG